MSGLLVIISSPSGGGKTSIIHNILARYPKQFVYSVSATTRKPRPNEVHGKDYFFLSTEQFEKDINNDRFLEWEIVHGYYYGTPKKHIYDFITRDKNVLLDIDVKGAFAVTKKFTGNAITIFIVPPSIDELIRRLKNRKTDSNEEIDKRLKRIPMEMENSNKFDYIVINKTIIKTEIVFFITITP